MAGLLKTLLYFTDSGTKGPTLEILQNDTQVSSLTEALSPQV